MRRLNLGSADRYVEGWYNVDLHAPTVVDERVDLTGELPWKPGTFTHVYAGHVLEHLPFDDARRLLTRLLSCVTDGAVIMVVGPDVDIAERMVENGTFDFAYHTLHTLEFGDDRWAGTQHQWRCTTGLVIALLVTAGWHNVVSVGIENVGEDWPVVDRGQRWQCAVQATRS